MQLTNLLKLSKLTKILSVILVALIIVVTTVLVVNQAEYKLKVPKGFISAKQDQKKTKISKVVGMSAKEVEKYFEDNSLLLLAVDEKNVSQIKLSCFSNSFSEKTVNFSYLDDEKIMSFSENIFSKVSEDASSKVTIVENKKVRYLKKSEAHKDNGGGYVVTQYVTVVNGKLYRLSILTPGPRETELSANVFKDFRISVDNNDNAMSVFLKVLLTCGVVLFAGLIILTVITFIKNKEIFRIKKDVQ